MPTITFKTITQLSFTLDLEPSMTIGEVKKKIADEKGDDYAVELQKLIYNGKILTDSNTIEEVGIDTSKFVVVMLSRKKAPAAAPATETTAPASTPAAVPVAAPSTPAAPAPTPAAPSAAGSVQNDDAPLTAEQEAMVQNIISMGYPRIQVVAVLRASLWNPDRAVDLLLSGDPEGEALGVEEEMPENEEGIAALANQPQIAELRELVRSNPNILNSVMQQIAQLNPELMQHIASNQEAFLRYLSSDDGPQAGGAAAGGAAGGAGPANFADSAHGTHEIRLTREENAAVVRIKAMGFNIPDQLIYEAYLACDKNEELAVDYILNRMQEDDV